MSFTDRLLLWFHIGFVVFTIGPVTIATMSTPRYIRAGNVGGAALPVPDDPGVRHRVAGRAAVRHHRGPVACTT